MKKKNKIWFIIIILLILLIITLGISYAYFSANIIGNEKNTTITVTGGVMNIHYDGGAKLNIEDIVPSNSPFTIKTFTVTGNNTSDIEMFYEVFLIIEENTFTEEALKYKLISTNTSSNGNIIPSINDLTNIGTGAKNISLGIGSFVSPTNGPKIHTYNLELYFPETDTNQNIDLGKNIKAYIEIKSVNKPLPLLTDLIIIQGGGLDEILNRGIPNFENINGISNLFATEDEYGVSYYYRGLKSELNNNLIFAGFQWKIIRINGDGSIRIIYNGICPENNCSINESGESTNLISHGFNLAYKDNKHIGFMYGGLEDEPSNSYEEAVVNQTSSDVKKILDSWYQENLFSTIYEENINDNLFCNDREIDRDTQTGLGYGANRTEYQGQKRILTNNKPSLKCNLINDRFTVSDTIVGNGKLTYPIGLITADEVMFAGMTAQTENYDNYLYSGVRSWTMTPSQYYYYSTGGADLLRMHAYGYIENAHANYTTGIRPVINLKSNVKVIGDGDISNPYIIP